jgi:ankyrin repeat protein
MFAAIGGRADMVSLLLEHGADCTVNSRDGFVTPFMSPNSDVLGILESFNAISHSSAETSVQAARERKKEEEKTNIDINDRDDEAVGENDRRSGSNVHTVSDELHKKISEKMKYHKGWLAHFPLRNNNNDPGINKDSSDPGIMRVEGRKDGHISSMSIRIRSWINWTYMLPIAAGMDTQTELLPTCLMPDCTY